MKKLLIACLLGALTTAARADTTELVLGLKPLSGGKLDGATLHQAGAVLRARLSEYYSNFPPKGPMPHLKTHAGQFIVVCPKGTDLAPLRDVLRRPGQISLQVGTGGPTPQWTVLAEEHSPAWFTSARYVGSNRLAAVVSPAGLKVFQQAGKAALNKTLGLFLDGTLVESETMSAPFEKVNSLMLNCPHGTTAPQARQMAALLGSGTLPVQASIAAEHHKP